MVLFASVLFACLLSTVLAAHPQRNLPIIDRVDANSALRTDLNSHSPVPRQVPEESRRLGLTLEPCKTDDDCASPRRCLGADDCSKGGCVCYNRQECSDILQCPAGEECISDLALPKFANTCASCSFFPGSSLMSFLFEGNGRDNNCISNGLPIGAIDPKFPAMNTFFIEKGYNFDACTKDEHCLAPRRCISKTGADSCTPKTCACFAKIDCSIDNPCTSPETCAAGLTFSNICIQCEQIFLNPSILSYSSCGAAAPGIPALDPSLQNLNLPTNIGSTEGQSEIQGSTSTATTDPSQNPTSKPTPSGNPGQGIGVSAQLNSNESPNGSAVNTPSPIDTEEPQDASSSPIATIPQTSQESNNQSNETTTTASEEISSPSPSSSPSVIPPCIAADALSHLPQSHLLYMQHIDAPVLCDENGSCATSGHIVVYKGTAMMMGSYCDMHATCSERIMPVNNPKRWVQRAHRVPSKTQELYFTVFSARYQTRAEEYAIRAVVHAGL